MADQDPPAGSDAGASALPAAAIEERDPAAVAALRDRGSRSLRFARGEDAERPSAMMDTANQSLADALRLTFRIVVVGMVVLAVVYVFSGVRQVQERQSGISLLFGRPTATNLSPGLHFTWPAPMGDLVLVEQGQQNAFALPEPGSGVVNVAEPSYNLEGEFIPFVERGALRSGRDDVYDLFPNQDRLNPERDDSLMTADLAVVHGHFEITFEREDPVAWAENVDPAMEGRILLGVVRRAILRAVAETQTDEFLKPTTSSNELPLRAQEIANQMLAELSTGVEIRQLNLKRRMPPRFLRDRFAAVQAAESEAGQEIQRAQGEANSIRVEAAGQRYDVLLGLIERYEEEITTGRGREAADTLARIHAFMEGRRVEVEGQEYAGAIGGEVSRLISEAQADRQEIVQRARGEADVFDASLEAYSANPEVWIRGALGRGYNSFMANPTLEVVWLPDTDVGQITIGRDPDLTDRIIEEINRREADRAREDRLRRQQAERARLQQGLPTED